MHKVYAAIALVVVTLIGGMAAYSKYLTNRLEAVNQDLGAVRVAQELALTELQRIEKELDLLEKEAHRLQVKFQESRQKKQEALEVFYDHNFEALAKAKPGLITRRMQKATEKVFKEIEEEANE